MAVVVEIGSSSRLVVYSMLLSLVYSRSFLFLCFPKAFYDYPIRLKSRINGLVQIIFNLTHELSKL